MFWYLIFFDIFIIKPIVLNSQKVILDEIDNLISHENILNDGVIMWKKGSFPIKMNFIYFELTTYTDLRCLDKVDDNSVVLWLVYDEINYRLE